MLAADIPGIPKLLGLVLLFFVITVDKRGPSTVLHIQ